MLFKGNGCERICKKLSLKLSFGARLSAVREDSEGIEVKT